MKDDGTRWLTIVGKQAGAPGGPQQKVVPQLRAATNPSDVKADVCDGLAEGGHYADRQPGCAQGTR